MRFLAVALALGGCVPAAAPPESTPPPPEAGACNAAPSQGLIGRQSSPALAGEARRLSGARVWRWLRPGQIVTMEYRADWLNIRVDGQGKVLAITCG